MQTVREDNRTFPRLEPLWDDPLTAALATSSAPPPLKERFSGLRNAFVDGNDIVAEIQDNVVTATYLRGLNIDEPFMRTSSTGQEFYHTDALGSVLALTNDAGAVQTTYRYDPFGNTTVTGTSTNVFQFTGRENDATGLYYYRARYYSPGLQRFVNEDPIQFDSGDFNFYAYVGNSPTNFTDSSGLIIDIAADAAFILYDLYSLAVDGRKNLGINLAALSTDIGGAFIPFVTGLGLGVRVTKGALTSAQAANFARFAKKLPKDAGPIRTVDLPGGGKAFQADVPAKDVPGSYATYEKQVDAKGNTILFTKTTYAPDGSIVHVKQKFP